MCEIARSQAALMAKFAKFKRLRRLNFANFAMRAAWLRAIPHTTPTRHSPKIKSIFDSSRPPLTIFFLFLRRRARKTHKKKHVPFLKRNTVLGLWLCTLVFSCFYGPGLEKRKNKKKTKKHVPFLKREPPIT